MRNNMARGKGVPNIEGRNFRDDSESSSSSGRSFQRGGFRGGGGRDRNR